MNSLDFCETLGDIRPEWLAEAETVGAPRRPAHRRKMRIAVLVAACICLICSSAAVLAASDAGTKLLSFFTDRREDGSDLVESGYDLSVSVEQFPTDAFSEALLDTGAVIVQQCREHTLYSSAVPGLLKIDFATRADACAFIGLDRLIRPDFPLAAGETTLSILGSAAGEIESLHLETSARDGDIRLQFFTEIYTEHHDGDFTLLARSTEHLEWRESFYTTRSGKSCHIIESSATESGYAGTDAYLVDGGILYQLHLAYRADDAQRAEELLHSWADCF